MLRKEQRVLPVLRRRRRGKFVFSRYLEYDDLLVVLPVRHDIERYSLMFLGIKEGKIVMGTGEGIMGSLDRKSAVKYVALLLSKGELTLGSFALTEAGASTGVSYKLISHPIVYDGSTIRVRNIELNAEEFPELAKIIPKFDRIYALTEVVFDSIAVSLQDDTLLETAKEGIEAIIRSWPNTEKIPDIYWYSLAYALTMLFAKPEKVMSVGDDGKIYFLGIPLDEVKRIVDLGETLSNTHAVPKFITYLDEWVAKNVLHNSISHMDAVTPLPYLALKYGGDLWTPEELDYDIEELKIRELSNAVAHIDIGDIRKYLVTSLLYVIGVRDFDIKNNEVIIQVVALNEYQRRVLAMLGCSKEGEQMKCGTDKLIDNYFNVLSAGDAELLRGSIGSDLALYLIRYSLIKDGLMKISEKHTEIDVSVLSALIHYYEDFFDLTPSLVLFMAGYLYGEKAVLWRKEVGQRSSILMVKIGEEKYVVFHRDGKSKKEHEVFVLATYFQHDNFDIISGIVARELYPIPSHQKKNERHKALTVGDLVIRGEGIADAIDAFRNTNFSIMEIKLSPDFFDLPRDIIEHVVSALFGVSQESTKFLIEQGKIKELVKVFGGPLVPYIVRDGADKIGYPVFGLALIPYSFLEYTDPTELVEAVDAFKKLDASSTFLFAGYRVKLGVFSTFQFVGYRNGRIYLFPLRILSMDRYGLLEQLLRLRNFCSIENGYVSCDVEKIKKLKASLQLRHDISHDELAELKLFIETALHSPRVKDTVLRLYKMLRSGKPAKVKRKDVSKYGIPATILGDDIPHKEKLNAALKVLNELSELLTYLSGSTD